MFQFTEGFCRARRVVACGTAALFLAIGCLDPGRGQQITPPAISPQQFDISANAPADIQEGIRKGTLFYATAPLSERALRHKDKTSAGYSFTLPLTVDRVHNRLSIQALINDRKIRLILDTGGGPGIILNEATARDIKLTSKSPTKIGGVQGYEAANLGLARSLKLGNLTLEQVPTAVIGKGPSYTSTLGLSAFEHYRVTLDFAANTMTLTRGGVAMPSPGRSSLSVRFDDDQGYIFIPVRVLGQDGWAVLDSGGDVNCLPFGATKAAAACLPSSDFKTIVTDQKIGLGDTNKKFNAIVLKTSVPISVNTGHDDADFSTTSRVGTSDIDDVLDPMFDTHIAAQLGFPFLVQFQRVIIDYPSHTLILQYPSNNTYIKVPSSPTDQDKPWPGYRWRQVGYAWIEVPDGSNSPVPVSPVIYPRGTVVINMPVTTSTSAMSVPATRTAMRVIVVAPVKDGNITVTVDGASSVYSFPVGSTVKVEKGGRVHIMPPGSAVRDENDGSVSITPGAPRK